MAYHGCGGGGNVVGRIGADNEKVDTMRALRWDGWMGFKSLYLHLR